MFSEIFDPLINDMEKSIKEFRKEEEIKELKKMKRPLTKKGLIRKQKEDWMNAVRERDNYKCQICGNDCSKRAHAHHIIPRQIKQFQYDVNNGITLCFNHHKVGAYSPHQNALWFSEWLRLHKKEQYEYIMCKLKELNKYT